MSSARLGVWMGTAALIFAVVSQVGVFWVAAGPGKAPVAEAMNEVQAK